MMQTFALAPSGTRPVSFVAFVLVIVAVALFVTLAAMHGGRFEVSSGGLGIRGDLWGRFIEARHLRTGAARRVDFAAEPDLLPGWRTMGTGLPGYSSGWFRLRNGERALVYLTDRSRVVYIPTDAGYSLVLSPDDPDAFLAAIRALR